MRTSPKKLIVAIALSVALPLALATPAPADTAEFDAVGTITLESTPPQVVEVGTGDPHPCDDPDATFAVTASGSASSGTLDISLPPRFVRKPASNPAVYDEFRRTVLFDDLTYTLVAGSPPHVPDYEVDGGVVLELEIWNVEQEELPCTKTDHKCSFVMLLDLDGTVLHNHPSSTWMPTFAADATIDLVATTYSANGVPVTYAEGDCDEYLWLDGQHVSVDLILTRV